MWRRVGDSAEIRYDYQHGSAGSAGSGGYNFSLPPGLTADLNKVTALASAIPNLVGTASGFDGTTVSWGYTSLVDSTHVQLSIGNQTNALNPVGSSFCSLSGTVTRYSFTATVPIVGWS